MNRMCRETRKQATSREDCCQIDTLRAGIGDTWSALVGDAFIYSAAYRVWLGLDWMLG